MSPALTRCLSAAASGFLKEFARAESITDGQGVRESATFELQTGAPARSHVACLHNYQLSRSAWRASPSMTNTSPCVPSMPPSPFCPPCAQVRSKRSTSRRSSRPPCSTASEADTATTRTGQCFELLECCFGMRISSFRDAHADVLCVFVR